MSQLPLALRNPGPRVLEPFRPPPGVPAARDPRRPHRPGSSLPQRACRLLAFTRRARPPPYRPRRRPGRHPSAARQSRPDGAGVRRRQVQPSGDWPPLRRPRSSRSPRLRSVRDSSPVNRWARSSVRPAGPLSMSRAALRPARLRSNRRRPWLRLRLRLRHWPRPRRRLSRRNQRTRPHRPRPAARAQRPRPLQRLRRRPLPGSRTWCPGRRSRSPTSQPGPGSPTRGISETPRRRLCGTPSTATPMLRRDMSSC